MNRLSNELIDLIVQQVDRHNLKECTFVNRQFHTLANPILWRQLDIHDEPTFDLLQRSLTLQLGQHIQRAQFGRHLPGVLTDDTLATFTRRTPNLGMLEVGNASKLTQAGLAHCPQLGLLKLVRCHMASLEGLRQSGLHQLVLESCYSGHGLVFLPTTLTTLTMTWCHNNQGSLDTTLRAIDPLQQLTSLVLMDYYDLGACLTMTWPRLTCLQLKGCPDLTDDIAIAFIQRHPHLRTLVLSEAIFTDTTLDAIATYLPGILHLGVSFNTSITHLGLRRLVQRCMDLVKLEFNGCDILIDAFPEMKRTWSAEEVEWGRYFLDQPAIAAIQLTTLAT